MNRSRPHRVTSLAAAGLLAAAPLFTACITETEGGTRASQGVFTQGVTVNDDVESTWRRVRSIVGSMTSEPLASNGPPRSIRTEIRGATTTVLVERRDAYSTAVHVVSEDDGVEDAILYELMR